MADELEHLKRKVFVARKELNNIRKEMSTMKKLFIHKFKELQEKSKSSKSVECDLNCIHTKSCLPRCKKLEVILGIKTCQARH